jgi:hypothetical protein
MTPKNILCDIINQKGGERVTHIDQISIGANGRELFAICEQFSIRSMQYLYKRDLRVSRLLYFIIGVIATIVFNLIF